MTKHFSNPVNCVDPEPPVDPNWKPKRKVVNLEALGDLDPNFKRTVLHCTDPEPEVDTTNFVEPKGVVWMHSLGEPTPVIQGKTKFPFVELHGIDNEAA